MSALFVLGRVVATPAALASAGQSPEPMLARHVAGDWGEFCDADRSANQETLQSGSRLMSVYNLGGSP